jgi:hypothetical protein
VRLLGKLRVSHASPSPEATATPADTGVTIDASTPQINECMIVSLADLTDAVGDQFTNAGKLAGDTCTFDGYSTAVTISTYDLSAYGSSVQETSA